MQCPRYGLRVYNLGSGLSLKKKSIFQRHYFLYNYPLGLFCTLGKNSEIDASIIHTSPANRLRIPLSTDTSSARKHVPISGSQCTWWLLPKHARQKGHLAAGMAADASATMSRRFCSSVEMVRSPTTKCRSGMSRYLVICRI